MDTQNPNNNLAPRAEDLQDGWVTPLKPARKPSAASSSQPLPTESHNWEQRLQDGWTSAK